METITKAHLEELTVRSLRENQYGGINFKVGEGIGIRRKTRIIELSPGMQDQRANVDVPFGIYRITSNASSKRAGIEVHAFRGGAKIEDPELVTQAHLFLPVQTDMIILRAVNLSNEDSEHTDRFYRKFITEGKNRKKIELLTYSELRRIEEQTKKQISYYAFLTTPHQRMYKATW